MTAGAALLAALLPLLAAPPPTVPPEPAPGRGLVPRGRWHHELAGPPRLRWSILFRRTEEADETRLLVEVPSGRFELVSTQAADEAWAREEVLSRSLGERVSRLVSHRPPGGVPECAPVVPPDACVVLSGSRGSLAAPLSVFSGREAAAWKARAARVVSPAFLSALRGLAPAVRLPDFAFYSEDFLALLEPSLARPPGADLSSPRLPGCEFEAGFGYPCTPDERRREEWLFRRPAPAPRRPPLTPEAGRAPGGGGRGRS